MVDATHKSFKASDRSYYAIIKREVHNLALAANFNEKKISELDIIVAELTSNLLKYADGGEILAGILDHGGNEFIELICIDEGPGIQDAAKMVADGFSTTHTLGHGLGSINRLADRFDIFSMKGWGTIVLCRVYKNAPEKSRKLKKDVLIYPIVVNKPGETKCGDGFYFKKTEQYFKLMLADGLGHGPEANRAVNETANAFKTCPYNSPVEILRYLHESVRKTRGAVVNVAVIDMNVNMMYTSGIGNISSKVFGVSQVKSYLSYNGIVGHNIPNTMFDQKTETGEYQQLVMCSDGIRSRWDLAKYLGIQKHDPSIQAAAIYKDFARQTDDMSVVVCKFQFK